LRRGVFDIFWIGKLTIGKTVFQINIHAVYQVDKIRLKSAVVIIKVWSIFLTDNLGKILLNVSEVVGLRQRLGIDLVDFWHLGDKTKGRGVEA